MEDLDPNDLVFLDEAGSTIAMTPARARSPKGERAHGKVPRNRGVVATILGALTLAGVGALMTIEGATTGEVFTSFVRDVLAPTLQPGNVVVLDNLGAHRTLAAKALVEAAGARPLFLPPYSPDLNPIEEAWSKVKGHIRRQEPRTIETLDASIVDAVAHVTPEDAAGWIRHAGYHVIGLALRNPATPWPESLSWIESMAETPPTPWPESLSWIESMAETPPTPWPESLSWIESMAVLLLGLGRRPLTLIHVVARCHMSLTRLGNASHYTPWRADFMSV